MPAGNRPRDPPPWPPGTFRTAVIGLTETASTAFSAPQSLVQTVVTNVPGPRTPLYILGRRMEGGNPCVPIGNAVRLSVAIFFYLDTFPFGVTADYDAVPDLDVLVGGIGGIGGIGRSLAELRAPR